MRTCTLLLPRGVALTSCLLASVPACPPACLRLIEQLLTAFKFPGPAGTKFARYSGIRAKVVLSQVSTAAVTTTNVAAATTRGTGAAPGGSGSAAAATAVSGPSEWRQKAAALGARRSAAAAFGGAAFAEVFSSSSHSAPTADVSFLLDHHSLSMVTPHESLANGRINFPNTTTSEAPGGVVTAEEEEEALQAEQSARLLQRRLRPELFARQLPPPSTTAAAAALAAAGGKNTKSSTSEAMMARLQDAVPGGNLSLAGSAAVLQKLQAVVRMLGSLQPKYQRFPEDVAVSE